MVIYLSIGTGSSAPVRYMYVRLGTILHAQITTICNNLNHFQTNKAAHSHTNNIITGGFYSSSSSAVFSFLFSQ
jgi:DeoR/GlpR family transcriptional regulator of sugar metabolism